MATFTRFKFKPINTQLQTVVHTSKYIRTENTPDETAKPEETTGPEVPTAPAEPQSKK